MDVFEADVSSNDGLAGNATTPESALFAAVEWGVRRAIGRVLVSQQQWLTRYVVRRLPADLRAVVGPDDVVQETYVEALRRAWEFRPAGPGSLRRWLATLASHRLCDIAKGQRRIKRGLGRVQRAGEDRDMDPLAALAATTRAPDHRVGDDEARCTLLRALNDLRPEYREALRLRYLCGLSPVDVARHMGRSSGAVGMLCNRAVKRLRRALSKRAVH